MNYNQAPAGVYEAGYHEWLNGTVPDRYSTCVAIERVLLDGLRRERTS